MDISKYKELIQRLNIFKHYSSLLVSVVIGLIAVLLFIPTQLMSSRLRGRIADESISKGGQQIQSLSENVVARSQWKEEQEYQQAWEGDANQIKILARQSTQRPLLSYKIFPKPKDTSTLIFEEFGQRYRALVEQLIARINGRDCPTDAELERNLQSSKLPGSGRARRRLLMRLSEVDATIVDVLCRTKAESSSVYINPTDLSGYEFWQDYEYTGVDETVQNCWYYQLAYWMIEDVVDTIGALNSGSNSVLTSPVKRLLSVNFTTGRKRMGLKSSVKVMDASDKPKYVLSIEDGLTESCTGRLCSDDIDIVHFNISVVVDIEAVLSFMQQLCSAKQHKFRGFFGESQEQVFKRNQITILESKVAPVDREDETHGLYRYGEDAVVQLDLVCEYIFNKSGYDEIKPELIKESLKKEEEPAEKRKRRR